MLDATPVKAFSDNYIWLVHSPRQPRDVAVVDPGDAAPVIEALEREHLNLRTILVTHHHADHVGGVAQLRQRYGVPVIGPGAETIPERSRSVAGGDRVTLPELGLEFEVFDVPGHTRGHIAFYGHGALFCGDTLFSAGCGRLFEGTPAQMQHSLATLRNLPGDTRVYCAHEYTLNNLKFALTVEPENGAAREYLETAKSLRSGNKPTVPSTLSLEIAVNPFLRWDAPTVQKSAERRAGCSLENPVEVFATIRRWKDGFN
ncbi:MAG TPA: hydroxyacylglutathione hydrolase [Steroidobacteraceae bacterium]